MSTGPDLPPAGGWDDAFRDIVDDMGGPDAADKFIDDALAPYEKQVDKPAPPPQ